ncbi:hypothetical protein EAG_14567 [Camponotus floridanus]|uniref:Uncharacterized protein n=1 Tax=Camponotus floridanus TaxID=104421 RepID=E2AT53_CAMFO|nr:hypothetical protein EAG_14567 [Camponotus floridanus]
MEGVLARAAAERKPFRYLDKLGARCEYSTRQRQRYDSTGGVRFSRFFAHAVNIRRSIATRIEHPETQRQTNVALSINVYNTIVRFSSVAYRSPENSQKIDGSAQGLSGRETRKWRRRQNGRPADQIAYVAHNKKMGNLTSRWGWSSASSLPGICGDTTQMRQRRQN